MQFANPAFLLWLPLAAVPCILHLLTRRAARMRTLPTAAILERSVAGQSRIARLRDLLLLLLRTTAILAAVTLFVKPVRPALLGAPGSGQKTTVILLDLSLSMHAGGVAGTALQKALAEADRVLASAEGQRINIVLMRAHPTALFQRPATAVSELRSRLRQLEGTLERGDAPAALAVAAAQLGQSASAGTLVVISDFQRTNWAEAHWEEVPAGVRLVMIDVRTADRTLGLARLRFSPDPPQSGGTAAATVEVFNSSDTPQTAEVLLTDAADREYRRSVVVPPWSTANAQFSIEVRGEGVQTWRAEIENGSPAAVRRAWYSSAPRKGLRVLVVSDENPASADSGLFYWLSALAPNPQAPGAMQVKHKRGSDLTASDLADCDVLFIHSTTTIAAGLFPRLVQYVREGGFLVCTTGGSRSSEQLASLQRIAGPADPLPFLTTQKVSLATKGRGSVSLGEARFESRLLRIFKDPAAADLSKPLFTTIWLTTEPAPRAETLLKYEDGTTAAARSSLGSGTVLLLNMSPSPSDSDLARSEVFAPLLHEMLKGIARSGGSTREVHPGGTLGVTIPAGNTDVEAVSPSGRSLRCTVDAATGSVVLDRVEEVGVYRFLAAGRETARAVVNIDPDELDLRPVSPKDLQAKSERAVRMPVVTDGAESVVREKPLWHWAAAILLIALLLEQTVRSLTTRGARYETV